MNVNRLEQLLDQCGPVLALYAATWCDCPEDCVQEAFIKLVCQDSMPEQVKPWLFRVVKHLAINQRRSTGRRRLRERSAGLQNKRFYGQCEMFEAGENRLIDTSELGAAINGLNRELREIVVARTWGELTFEEIGKLAGCSSSAAHRRYETGLNELRKALGLTWLIHGKT